MKMKIKDLPLFERPYEKLEKYGESSLSDAELLAIIIKTGTKDSTSIDLAREILLQDLGSKGLRFLNYISYSDLLKIRGIGKVKALQIKATVELAKRISTPLIDVKTPITSSFDVFNLLKEEVKFERVEVIKVVILDNKNCVLKILSINKGNQSSVIAEPKDILIEAIRLNASAIILVHNHPSGNPNPSNQDIIYTNRLYEAANIIGIPLLDHIIIGEEKYKSLSDMGKLQHF